MPQASSNAFTILGKTVVPQQKWQQASNQQAPLLTNNQIQQQQITQSQQLNYHLSAANYQSLPNIVNNNNNQQFHQQQPQQQMPQQPQNNNQLPAMLQPSGGLGLGAAGQQNPAPPASVSSMAAPPQDIAECFTVSSGAFKVVALTKEQLRQVNIKKHGAQEYQSCDPIVIQPKDIQYAITKSPNLNNQSSKAAMASPIQGYGFESVAFNTKLSKRQLPNGLGGAASHSNSPNPKRTPLSAILVERYLPTAEECN